MAEVIEMLRTKQVSIIDEVRQPIGRWSYIRDNPLFTEAVNSVRAEQESYSDETMTQSVAQHTMTRTDNIHYSDDFTRTPVLPEWEKTPGVSNPRTSNLKDVTPPAGANTPTAPRKLSSDIKSYGATEDVRVKGKIHQKSNFLKWLLVGATTLVVVGVIAVMSERTRQKTTGFEELVSQAVRFKSLGLYENSLQAYTKASKIQEPVFDIQVKLAPVLISEERQTLVGRRILEKAVTQEGRNRDEIVEAYLAIAVSHMIDGDLKQAEEVLQKVIGYEPFNLSALLNSAIVQHRKGDYLGSIKSFDKIFRKFPEATLALVGKALSTLEYVKIKADTPALQALIREMNQNMDKSGYFRQELSLLIVAAHSLIGDINGMNLAIVGFLGQLPSQLSGQQKYVHPLTVDWRFAQWDVLEKVCSELYRKANPHPELKALRAICQMEVNRDVEAGKLLQEATVESPHDPYVLITQASYFNKMGRYPEALTILKTAELKNLATRHLLQGDICIKMQNISCAKQAYMEAYSLNNQSAPAAAGLAAVFMSENDSSAAYNYVRSGLQLEPNYLPLLELREKLESP